MKRELRIFLSALSAGICIALGGIVFLSLDNKVIGALCFTVGLFTICSFGLNLFTGKVCYVFDNDKTYAANLIVIWLGNLAGTFLTAKLAGLTRIGVALSTKAAELCRTKLSDSFVSLFVLGLLCNILIYIAVESFKNSKHDIGRYLGLFFGVVVFILSGFEHSVADMFSFPWRVC